MSKTEMSDISNGWEVKTKEILIRLQREAPQEGLGYGLSQYILDRRPFALAIQSAQDLKDHASRLVDLVCGVPYTSEKHPWPKDRTSGLWMQPILQLNLATLKEVFQVDWGEGLLQVWGHVFGDLKTYSICDQPLKMLILPKNDISEPIDAFIPDWRNGGAAKSFTFFDDSSFAGHEVFHWSRAGEMYGTRQQLLDFSYDKVDDFGDEEFEWLDGVMEAISESPLCGENQSDYLGGWGGRHGEQDASYGDGLVLRISDGEGAVVAIHRNSAVSAESIFQVSYSLR